MEKMNRSGNILFCLCTALLLAADMGRAETVIWSDNFDDSGAGSRWTTSSTWHISSPTAGPAKNSEGNRTHSGAKCASTQNYAYNDSRLVCINYNGDSTLVVPSADQFPRLRFWHWFNLGSALGFVEIKAGTNGWQQISLTYTSAGTATSGGVWSRPSIDLSAFAGQSVKIAFRFAGLCCGNGLGWYVDDVEVVTGQPVFNNPEGFESDVDDWAVDFGTWEIGTPIFGPSKNSEGYRTHTGAKCAATILSGNYPNNVDSRLISPPFLVPSNSPVLRFYHWYNFNNALGYVEVSTDAGSTWNQLLTYQNGNTGNVWKNVSLDLSAYAGQTVQAAFRFASGGIYTAAGWYVDDLSLAASPTLTVPPTQTIYAGQTLTVTNYATVFPTNGTPAFGLVSHLTGVVLNPTTGVLTWTPTSAQTPSTNTITVKVTDNNVPPLSATVSFIVQVLPSLVLTPPPTQTIYAGQELDVTISATNYANPDDFFTFKTNSPTPTNVWIDLNIGVLTWTPTAAQKGSNTITITVTNNLAPFFRATNHFVVVVSTNIPPPTLTVPPTKTIYAGQTLTVTNTATSVFPNSAFTFATNSPPTPTGVILVPTNGVLTWAIPTTNMAASYQISVTVTDSVSKLIATKTFVVVVSTNPPPPMLIVPPTQTNYAGQTMMVTNHAYYTNSALPSSAFTFMLLSGPANMDVSNLPTNGVLRWVIPFTQPSGTTNISIMVTDCVSHLIATSNFLVQVLPPQPPTLIVPPMQLIYAGQTMDVTISATSVYPDDTFIFAAYGPTNLVVSNRLTSAVLKWTPLAAQAAPSPNTIYVKATDINSLSSISNFLVLVFTTPQPGFMVSPAQTLKSNGFQFSLNTIPDTTWRIDTSTNLSSWRPLLTNLAGPSGTLQFTDLLATNYLRRFYRAVLP